MEAGCLPPGHQTLQPPGRCTLGRLKKTRILAPDSWAARLLCLPIRRKVLSSLTWDIWFSLIINNLLMFRLPGLCCKSSYIFPGSPFSSLEAVSQSCLRCYILGWNPPFLHWIKHNSPLKKIFIYLLLNLLLAMLGLHCFLGFSLSVASGNYPSVASLHSGFSHRAAWALECKVILSCSPRL